MLYTKNYLEYILDLGIMAKTIEFLEKIQALYDLKFDVFYMTRKQK